MCEDPAAGVERWAAAGVAEFVVTRLLKSMKLFSAISRYVRPVHDETDEVKREQPQAVIDKRAKIAHKRLSRGTHPIVRRRSAPAPPGMGLV